MWINFKEIIWTLWKYRYKTAQFTWWYYLFKPMVISKSKSQLNICWEKIKLYIGNYPGQQLKQYHHKWHHNVPIHTKHEHKPTEKWQVNKYFHKTLTSSLSIIWTKLVSLWFELPFTILCKFSESSTSN